MKTITTLLSFILFSCAAYEKNDRTAETASPQPQREVQVVTRHIDTPPEPIGGLAAIQAALREPEEMWKQNKEGWVIVEATINTNGRVIGTKIAKSSGYVGMDSEAMLAVARVVWKPARRRGAPVTATVRVPVVFERE